MVNRQQLDNILRMSISDFSQFGDVTMTKDGPMIFQDNGADLLAVAHLDYVLWQPAPHWSKNGGRVYAPQLDDRIGAYTILKLLKEFGLKYDILLCDSEELGMSTARYFKGPRQYNWLFEFDRAGHDVVTYDYDCPKWETALNRYFDIGYGAFSDISSLEEEKACAVNIGCGYHRQHTWQCYANISELEAQVKAFLQFHSEYKDQYFEHEPWSSTRGYYSYGYRSGSVSGTNSSANSGTSSQNSYEKNWERIFGVDSADADPDNRDDEQKDWFDYCDSCGGLLHHSGLCEECNSFPLDSTKIPTI